MRSSKICFWSSLTFLWLAGCAAVQAQVSTPAPAATETPEPVSAVLEYIGHSCFLLTAPDGTRIVMDPYRDYLVPREIQIFPKGITADAVVVSHFHGDHANWQAIQGARLIYEPGTDAVGMVKLTGFVGDHGIVNGAPVGNNTVWVFEIGSIKIVHMGANGVVTQPEILAALKDADVVIMRAAGDGGHPVPDMMKQLRDLNTRTLLPSHYSISAEYRYTVLTLDEFLALLGPDETVVRSENSELTVTPGMPRQVVVLKPSALASQPTAS
jgi:L-ascorbate metabolism protein UlaG (beta-lactamase superfamily)